MSKCPRAKSDMTPCYIKDGDLAIAIANAGWGAGARKICVGCEYGIGLLREQRNAAMISGKP
jgi:hypothetical protein